MSLSMGSFHLPVENLPAGFVILMVFGVSPTVRGQGHGFILAIGVFTEANDMGQLLLVGHDALLGLAVGPLTGLGSL